MKRGIMIGDAVLIVVIVAAVHFLITGLDEVVRATVEKVGSEVTQVEVTLDKAEVATSEGRAALRGLEVGNSVGFQTDKAFKMGSIISVAKAPGLKLASASLGGTSSNAEISCLALNIYWEARSEPLEGQLAVAHVTVNRMVHPKFPDTICGVVYQGNERTFGRCQFSWWCDGKSDYPTEYKALKSAENIAVAVLLNEHPDPSNGALFFHHQSVRPKWSMRKHFVTQIGKHLYYQ